MAALGERRNTGIPAGMPSGLQDCMVDGQPSSTQDNRQSALQAHMRDGRQ